MRGRTLWEFGFTIALVSSLAGAITALPAAAQDASSTPAYQQQRAAQRARDNFREQVNENVLFLMSGQPGASYLNLAHDIATVTNDGVRLRVLPVVGTAAVQNVSDVLFVVASTCRSPWFRGHQPPQADQAVRKHRAALVCIAPLENDELHILGGPGINSIEKSQGQAGEFQCPGSASALLGPRIFSCSRSTSSRSSSVRADAHARMRKGEIAATP